MSMNNIKKSTNHEIYLRNTLNRVQSKIVPVWPLADYVAVNPFAGFSHRKFMDTASQLASITNIELFMPLDYYRLQFRDGKLTRELLNMALDEMVADRVPGVESLDVNQILAALHAPLTGNLHSDRTDRNSIGHGQEFKTLTDYVDHYCGAQWAQAITDEISKHCASFYDAGQANWDRSESSESLYEEWRKTAQIDRNFEILGASGFRDFVANLPIDPGVAVLYLLNQLKVPESVWYELLLCEAYKLPGWSAWTCYQDQKKQQSGSPATDFVGLLAMRLAYQSAVSKLMNFSVNWLSLIKHSPSRTSQDSEFQANRMIRYALLKAAEIKLRQRLLLSINLGQVEDGPRSRMSSQIVFCIDVRSERIRRHLESTSSTIQTFGFAGFFGLPIEVIPMGEQHGHACVPILLTPKLKVREEIDQASQSVRSTALEARAARVHLRSLWQEFQSSAASCFSFVESLGLGYGAKLIAKSLGFRTEPQVRYDGIAKAHHKFLGPSLSGLEEQGFTPDRLVDLSESILKGIGLVDDFARLVVFCGHGSSGENNPLQAGLDCGACGGHTGQANARLAAKLLNQDFVRRGLAQKGILIPVDTHFLAALHNTTTDDLQFLDLHLLPPSHQEDLQELKSVAATASARTLAERQPSLSCSSRTDLLKRSCDWSEVRQEWGLAGNAAFIAGPREWTRSLPMNGRVFLHSYHFAGDLEFKVLEQIMTAPMVVAHWINMQYFASTVAPAHFSGGTKTIHNVVGKFGVLSGNGGDLMTGLPWQSLHDGRRYQHEPLRLLALVAASREAIKCVLSRNSAIEASLRNDWMQLVAFEESTYYRYTQTGDWEELNVFQVSAEQEDVLMPS